MSERSVVPLMSNGFVIFLETDKVPEDMRDLADRTGAVLTRDPAEAEGADLCLHVSDDGLSLERTGQILRCDFAEKLRRLKTSNLSGELLVRAAKIKAAEHQLTVIDATAGLGEDSLLLAAAGFRVKLYERNPVIAALLRDALRRALGTPELSGIVERMEAVEADSISELPRLKERPDVVFLDPMFPEKEKTGLTKKKFQLLHCLELPCADEEELLHAAILARPYKIVIKRPLKGCFLGNRKPSYSIGGKTIRYDCIVLPENAF